MQSYNIKILGIDSSGLLQIKTRLKSNKIRTNKLINKVKK